MLSFKTTNYAEFMLCSILYLYKSSNNKTSENENESIINISNNTSSTKFNLKLEFNFFNLS